MPLNDDDVVVDRPPPGPIGSVWRDHGTKLLGFAATFVSTGMLIDGLIPPEHLKYWLFANALLGGATVRRGFVNSKDKLP